MCRPFTICHTLDIWERSGEIHWKGLDLEKALLSRPSAKIVRLFFLARICNVADEPCAWIGVVEVQIQSFAAWALYVDGRGRSSKTQGVC